MTPYTPTTVRGFELLRKVADGSAVEAFLARPDGSDRSVLLEVSRAEVTSDVELYGRVLDSAVALQRYSHPHLLARQMPGCGPDGRVFVATEAVGASLAEVLQQKRTFTLEEAIAIIGPLCDAVGYLHSRGMVHGNLAPRNVFFADYPRSLSPKLLDTGLLLFRNTRSLKTPPAVVLVQPEYLSPERIKGNRASPSADIYGLGVLLHQLLLGKAPFTNDDASTTRSLHLTASIPVLPAGLRALQPIIGRCLQKFPAGRYGTPGELKAALEEVLRIPPERRDALDTMEIDVEEASEEAAPVVLGLEVPAETIALRSRTPQPSLPVLGSYQLLRPIGEGGMGRVFLARHVRLGREVAIKVLKPSFAKDPLHVRRFVQEAQAVNRVRHPNIVEIFDLVETPAEDGAVYCVMELLDGRTLKSVAKEGLAVERIIRLVLQAAGALGAAHRVGVVHRDVKLDNIFLVEKKGEPDLVKVIDFGIARLRDAEELSHATRAGEVVGTPAYMAPEQALPGPIDERVDVYALGTALFVLLEGRLPFDASNPEQLLIQKVTGRPRGLGTKTPTGERIPPLLRTIVARCLKREPRQRFQSMLELESALNRVLLPQEAGTPMWAVAAGAGAVLLGAAALGFGMFAGSEPKPAAPAYLAPVAEPGAPSAEAQPGTPLQIEVDSVEVQPPNGQPAPKRRPVVAPKKKKGR